MWEIRNRTAYSAERNWTRDKHGAHHWLVAVKATFDVSPEGRLTLADEQPPPALTAEHHGEPGASSLRYDSDLFAPKPGTDVLVDAHAHAPGGKPAKKVPVSLRVGALEKVLVAHGTRVYTVGLLGLGTSSPLPFTNRPIRYERAFGGTDTADPDPRRHRFDTRNPVGKGIASRSSRLEHQEAHAIEYPKGDPAKVGPAGFGPIQSFWSPRLELAGTYDERWAKSKKPLLADDYDERFASCAPADQQFAKPLRGGEVVELVHLTPAGLLRFELPKIFVTCTTRFGSRREEHRARLATVIIEPEQMRLMMVWQSALRVSSSDVDYLDETLVWEKPYLT